MFLPVRAQAEAATPGAVTRVVAIPVGAVFREAGARRAAAVLPGAGDDHFERRPRTHHEGHSVGRSEDLRRDRLRARARILACNGFSGICRGGGGARDALVAGGFHRHASPANPVRAGHPICRSPDDTLCPGRAGRACAAQGAARHRLPGSRWSSSSTAASREMSIAAGS